MKKVLPYALAILLLEGLGGLGAVFTMSAIPDWYAELTKPRGTPPNWVFGPVWTFLYAILGIILARIWLLPRETKGRRNALVWFGVQLLLNLAWTPVFFGMHQLLAGFVVIWALLGAIRMTAAAVVRVDRTAAGLLWPYALWVAYATYLNAGIWFLNR
jgi:translocator protein